MYFKDLDLSSELLRAIEKKGYSEATPIQQKAIPLVLQGKDLLAGAQTGTGKTAGFTLPLLQQLQRKYPNTKHKSYPKILILTPTRELAAQVHESVRDYSSYLNFRSAVVFGGVSITPQKQKLIRGVDIIIATPGRLLDHVQQRSVDLSRIETLVLDEADRMLQMGFIHDIRRVVKSIPKQRQTLLFSATFSSEIKRLAADFLTSPSEIQVTPENTTTERVSQVVYPVDKRRKRELLSQQIGEKIGNKYWFLRGPSTALIDWRRNSKPTVFRPRQFTEINPRGLALKPWPISSPVRSACWWPLISQPAVLIFISFPML